MSETKNSFDAKNGQKTSKPKNKVPEILLDFVVKKLQKYRRNFAFERLKKKKTSLPNLKKKCYGVLNLILKQQQKKIFFSGKKF